MQWWFWLHRRVSVGDHDDGRPVGARQGLILTIANRILLFIFLSWTLHRYRDNLDNNERRRGHISESLPNGVDGSAGVRDTGDPECLLSDPDARH